MICSCDKKRELKSENNRIVQKDTVSIIKTRIDLLSVNKKVSKKVEEVSSFEMVSKEVDSIKKEPLSKVAEIVPELNNNIVELYKTLPKDLKNKPILSRLRQLQTYSLLLEDAFKNNKGDSITLNNTIKQVLESYNVFVLQLNETENQISEDFQKELQKASFARDSLKQSEVAPLF